jgi:outer membrane protein assembly factor BamB
VYAALIPACAVPLCLLLASGCERAPTADAQWLVSSTQIPSAPEEGQWSGFRGGLFHGVSPDRGLPIRWNEDGGIKWKTPLPGPGNSSPTIWENMVLLSAEIGRNPSTLAVLCYDRRSGDLMWRFDAGPASGRTHRKNGRATPTVITDGKRIYATFGPLGAFCLGLSGEKIWHVPLTAMEHEWGYAASPVLAGDVVIQLCDGESDSCLIALDRFDGSERWRTPRDSAGCWATPVLVRRQNGQHPPWELIVNGTGRTDGSQGFVIAYDPVTGTELWRVRGTTDIPCPTAIVGENLIVSSSGLNGPIMAIRPGGKGDVTDTHTIWKLPWGGPYVPTGVIYKDRLFLLADGGVLRCHDLDTGEQIWTQRLHRTYSASLIAGDNLLYAVSERGDVHVLGVDQVDQQPKVLAVNRLRERCLSTPAVAKGELFIRSSAHLYCIASRKTEVAATDDAASRANILTSAAPATTSDAR